MPSDLFIGGSITKPMTSTAVMQLAETGLVQLDQPFVPQMDTLWRASNNGSSIREVFGSEIDNCTVRHLLSMQSGIADFDSPALQNWT